MVKNGIQFYEIEEDGKKYIAEPIYNRSKPRSRLSLDIVKKIEDIIDSSGSINHDNYINCLDIREYRGEYCIVHGEDDVYNPLQNYLENNEVSVENAVKWGLQIAEMTRMAEENNYCWQGISLNSLRVDEKENIHMLNPDIVKSISRYREDLSEIIDQDNYKPPEILEGEKWDKKGRMYTLGVILYYLLTGTAPFDADNKVDVLNKKIGSSYVDPRYLNYDVAKKLNDFIKKLMSRYQEKRFKNWDGVIKILENLLESKSYLAKERVSRRNKSRSKRIKRRLKIKEKIVFTIRKRWKAMAIVGVLVLMVWSAFHLGEGEPVLTEEDGPREVVEIFYQGFAEKDSQKTLETTQVELGNLEKLISRAFIMERTREGMGAMNMETEEEEKEEEVDENAVYGLKNISIKEIEDVSQPKFRTNYVFYLNKEEGTVFYEMEDISILDKSDSLWQIVEFEGDINKLIDEGVEM